MTLRCLRPIVAVTSKKSHTKLGSLMLYRILHWLPSLAWLSDDRAIHNPHCPTASFFERVHDVFPKQFDAEQT